MKVSIGGRDASHEGTLVGLKARKAESRRELGHRRIRRLRTSSPAPSTRSATWWTEQTISSLSTDVKARRGEIAMSQLEDRLAGFGNQLQELLERQRLSRFDTLMFLVYPVVITASTWLLNALWQINTLLETQVLFVSVTDLLPVGVGFDVFLVAGFLLFAYSYGTDNMKERVSACAILAFGTYVIAVFFSLLLIVATLYGPVTTQEVPQVFRTYLPWLGWPALIATVGWSYVLLVTALTVRSYVHNRVAAWFTRNLRLLLAGAGVPPMPGLSRLHRTTAMVAWFALCLPSYAFGIAYVFSSQGSLLGTVGFHYWILAGLTAAGVFLVVRRLDP